MTAAGGTDGDSEAVQRLQEREQVQWVEGEKGGGGSMTGWGGAI